MTVSVLRLWLQQWKRIFKVTAAAFILSAVVAMLLPARYESTTKLLPAPSTSGSQDHLLQDVAGFDGLDTPLPSERFVALLKSRVVADRIIDSLGLMKVYGARFRSEARNALASHTTIDSDRKSGVITVKVTDHDPDRAAKIAAAYVQELEAFNAEMNSSSSHAERVFLEKRVDEVTQQLRDASAKLSKFSTKSSLLDVQQQPKATMDAAMQLRADIGNAEAELRGLRQTYSPESLRVRTARAKLNELYSQLRQLQGASGGGQAAGNEKLPALSNLPSLSETFTDLAREVKVLEMVQQSLVEKLEIAKTDEVKQLPLFSIMEPAERPEQRAFPRRTSFVISCTMGAFLLALAWVLAEMGWKRLDERDPLKTFAAEIRAKMPFPRARSERLKVTGN